jgi:hypothetical protein
MASLNHIVMAEEGLLFQALLQILKVKAQSGNAGQRRNLEASPKLNAFLLWC